MTRTALITGASAGIGRDLAECNARDGHNLVLVARDGERLQQIAAELRRNHGVEVTVLTADLSAHDAPARIFAETSRRNIYIDILVNNAGFGLYGTVAELDMEGQLREIDVNIRALTALTRLYLPAMLQKKSGRILNIASTAAFQPGPLMAVYYATKAYVLSFSEALSNEVGDTGVTVTALCPGPTATEFQLRANMSISKLKKSGWLMGSMPVAKRGHNAMMRGRRLVIPGFINLLIAESTRISPRALTLRIARWVQEQARPAQRMDSGS